MEEKKNQIVQSSGSAGSVFLSKEGFEHAQRVSKMLSESDLVPDTFRNKIGNCVIALEMANRIGATPLMVMQNMYIVHGKPAWSSQFLIATLNATGKFSPIRYEDDEKEGGRTRAKAKDLETGEMLYGPWISLEMAKAEGWVEKKGSKWKTMPELMRRYRAAAFFVRQFAPEVSMGLMTQEEVQDIRPVEDADAVVLKPALENLDQAEKGIRMGTVTLVDLEEKYDLTDEQREALIVAGKPKQAEEEGDGATDEHGGIGAVIEPDEEDKKGGSFMEDNVK